MIDDSPFLKEIRNRYPRLGLLLSTIIDGVNGVSNHAGFDPTGKAQPPNAVEALNVKAGTDHVHVTLTDNSEVRKHTNYFVEWSANDPAFQNPHVEYLGPSRGKMLNLPAKDDGGTRINYYFKAYPQGLGSDPQTKHTFFGTRFAPTAVTLSGNSQLTPLASAGSGTGKSDGSQSGSGFGKAIVRPPNGPKRPPAPPATL